MLSSMHILSLKQGRLYGDRIPIEALPQGFTLPRRLVALIGRWRKHTKKDPAEAGPEVAEPQQAAPAI
ncbi:hypothetical protein [Rhizobium sp. BT03]|uniref:hypothetical protein n=1 Tax=Rhizobium sp. BT03 TaxID=3045156 RepID=UPI0024B3CC4F|nr:hypothetical protein [Rhizobium sp. BT03]WHO74553.1 hypothetical protein QMO80_003628 [Rhizobium sp. BT03]